LYTPTFVRDAPFINPVNTVTGCAAEDGNPGTNIPTAPPTGCGNGEYNRDVTTTVPAAADEENSTAPKEFGTPNKLTQISSNDLASRGANVNVLTGCDPNRYTAVTATLAVYDVLNTRTSEKNGANPCTDAATDNVTVSPPAPAASPSRSTAEPSAGASLLALMSKTLRPGATSRLALKLRQRLQPLEAVPEPKTWQPEELLEANELLDRVGSVLPNSPWKKSESFGMK
jgi:hypothetical protein